MIMSVGHTLEESSNSSIASAATMMSFSTIGLHLILLSNLTNMSMAEDYKQKERAETMRLSSNCTPVHIRLDQYDRVELTSNIWPVPDTLIQGNVTCTAHFMTGNKDQGICVHSRDLYFKRPGPGVQMRIYTFKIGPDKAFNYFHSVFRTWCTDQNLVSIELSSSRDFFNQNGEYRYSFMISNVSREDIARNYYMDSFKQCDLEYVLRSGEEIRIAEQRYPAPGKLPSSCTLHLSTDSAEEYEEVCVQIVEHRPINNCLSKLEIKGFNSRFWPESEVLGCNDTHSELRAKKLMCSGGKTLTLNLTRTSPSDTGMAFTAVVKAQKHPYWKVISTEYDELRGLGFVKGLTYFIAVIDSMAGIFGAILATMFRHPRSFWRSWAESMNAAEKCEAVHYEVTYPEVSGSKVEEITEVKSY